MIDIFDIMGPIMVGPSSSHTAGAVRIGNMARILLAEEPVKVKIHLHGSFAETAVGHGTDKALIAGILGMSTDDMDIPNSLDIAQRQGIEFCFDEVDLRDAHPNSVALELESASGKILTMQACSIGGGRILVQKIADVPLSFTGDYNTLIIQCQDDRGNVAGISFILSQAHINVANMSFNRSGKGGRAIMVLETDEPVGERALAQMRLLAGVQQVTYYEKEV